MQQALVDRFVAPSSASASAPAPASASASAPSGSTSASNAVGGDPVTSGGSTTHWPGVGLGARATPQSPATPSSAHTQDRVNGAASIGMTSATLGAQGGAKSGGKGKGRALETDSEAEAGDLASPTDEIEGRGKRIRKARRLGSDELDPNNLLPDGTLKRVVKKKPPRPAVPVFTADEPPMTKDDEAYFARVEANAARPALRDMRGACPVWALKRRDLSAAAEYLRDPKKTEGGSVEIGVGGLARGVILEGVAPGQGTFWGKGAQAGTIVVGL